MRTSAHRREVAAAVRLLKGDGGRLLRDGVDGEGDELAHHPEGLEQVLVPDGPADLRVV